MSPVLVVTSQMCTVSLMQQAAPLQQVFVFVKDQSAV